MLAVFLLIAAVAAVAADVTVIDGDVYSHSKHVALLSDTSFVRSTQSATFAAFPTRDVVVYSDEARDDYVASIYPDATRLRADTAVEWLHAITEMAEAIPGTRGVQWAVLGNKGRSGTRTRLWFIPNDVVTSIDQYFENTWIGNSARADLSTFENWLFSGVLMWCSGASSCGDVNATLGIPPGMTRTWLLGATSGERLNPVSLCASRHPSEVTPVDTACGCFQVAGIDSYFSDAAECYACTGEGVSNVWNVPSSACIQADFDPARHYSGTVFTDGPPRPLVHVPGYELIGVWHVRHPGVASSASSTSIPGAVLVSDPLDATWVKQHWPHLVDTTNVTLDFQADAPWDANAVMTQYAFNACVALGVETCSAVAWEPMILVHDGRVAVYAAFTAWSRPVFTSSYGEEVVERPSPSTTVDVSMSGGGVTRGYAPSSVYTANPSASAATHGFIVMCTNDGARSGCGPLVSHDNPFSTPTGDVFNPPWATSACVPRVAGTPSPQTDVCACGWSLTPIGQVSTYATGDVPACGNCGNGTVRTPSGECLECIDAASCDRKNTVTASCIGPYSAYSCTCAPGFDPETGCQTCLGDYVPLDDGRCIPCASYMGCHPDGTSECITPVPGSSHGECVCHPAFAGDACDTCNAAVGMFQLSPSLHFVDTDVACVFGAEWCGEWGSPDVDAGMCACSHGRTPDPVLGRCDTCNGTELCGPGGTCQTNPHNPAWCSCSGAPGVLPWWDKKPSSRCDACPPGTLPNDWEQGTVSGCSPAEDVCPGVVDVPASTIAGTCICSRGWRRLDDSLPNSPCTRCAPGFVVPLGTSTCVSCADVCGGDFHDVCVPNGTCMCSLGRAGPPCTGECAPGFRRLRVDDEGIDECLPCPPGCSQCTIDAVSRVTTCSCPPGTVGPNCASCAPGYVTTTSGTCAPCPRGGCLNGECVPSGDVAVCECHDGFDPGTRCTTCLSTHYPTETWECIACPGDGATCGVNGRCRGPSGGCDCDDGFAWTNTNGTCVPCDPRWTTGPRAGCVPCPDACPHGRRCVGVPSGSDTWTAVCGCDSGLIPSGATCTAPMDAWHTDATSGYPPWYTSVSVPLVYPSRTPPDRDARVIGILLSATAIGFTIAVALLITWAVKKNTFKKMK